MPHSANSSSVGDVNPKELAIILEASDAVPVVAVLGTGLYGRALAERLRASRSFEVRVGSRTPSGDMVSPEDAVAGASIVFLAVPARAHESVLASIGENLGTGTILVDVSNHALSAPPRGAGSLAERLQELAPPGIIVAKAFNTLSSYHIDPQGVSKDFPVVHIACSSKQAAQKLAAAVTRMGLTASHYGRLSTAAELEASPHRMFPTWRSSVYLSIIVFAWWLLYGTLSGYVIPRKGRKRTTSWQKYPLREFMATTGETCMTLFALTFIPGPVASLMQLVRGSASKPFGRFMGAWLGMRKELGVVAFFYASMHGIAGAVSGSHKDDGWKGGLYFVFGIISYALFAVLAISSSRSVADNMSWAEFRAVFSWMGVAALTAGVAHQGLWGWIIHKHRPDPSFWAGFGAVLPKYWLGIILPLVALLLRAITWSPCVVAPLRKLRNEVAVETKSIES